MFVFLHFKHDNESRLLYLKYAILCSIQDTEQLFAKCRITQYVDTTWWISSFQRCSTHFQGPLCPCPSNSNHSRVGNHLYSFTVPKGRQPDDSANLSKDKRGRLEGGLHFYQLQKHKVCTPSTCTLTLIFQLTLMQKHFYSNSALNEHFLLSLKHRTTYLCRS